MRTTVTLDDDVASLIDVERARTGESFKAAVNRLIRRGSRGDEVRIAPPLRTFAGKPELDVTDVSAVLSALDDERREQRSLP